MNNLLTPSLSGSLPGAVIGIVGWIIGARIAKILPAGQLAGKLQRGWQFVRSNPKSSLAGLATLVACFSPKYAGQITGIAAGVGLLMTSDADTASKDQHP